jgi:hypothetical protein
MSKAGCDGPMCTFLGDKFNSQAKKGECTGKPCSVRPRAKTGSISADEHRNHLVKDTAGYISNAEISRIIAEHNESAIEWWHDSASESDILVYEGQWHLGQAATQLARQRSADTSSLRYRVGGLHEP